MAKEKKGKKKEMNKEVKDEIVEEEKIAEIEAPLIEPKTPEEEAKIIKDELKKKAVDVSAWKPKTLIGRKVKLGEIRDVKEILDGGVPILESEIVDALCPGLDTDLLMIGQSKGKFGGGQRRVFRQTQKKTKEGNKPKFSTYAVVGDKAGIVGVGYGKSKETVPAREKALRNAKLNIIHVKRGCGSWQCGCGTAHSLPFAVEGRCGSVRMKLLPAPKGTGLVCASDVAKILQLAGIKDVWSATEGKTSNRINLINATLEALRKIGNTKIQQKFAIAVGLEGANK